MLARTIAGTVIRLGSHESRHVGMRRNAKARISGAAIVAAPVMPDSILCAWECHESFVQLVSIPRQSRWKKPSTTAPTPATNYWAKLPVPYYPTAIPPHSNCLSCCDNRDVSSVQNKGGATGGVTGRGFKPGRSGNPGGRPQGLARATRELVGEDGMKLAELWWSIASDETRRDSDRLEASKLLADRGWGTAAVFQPQEGDPLDLAALEGAAEEFRAKILRLARDPEPDGTLGPDRHS